MGSISTNVKIPQKISDSDFTRYPHMIEADPSYEVENMGTISMMARKIAANRSEK